MNGSVDSSKGCRRFRSFAIVSLSSLDQRHESRQHLTSIRCWLTVFTRDFGACSGIAQGHAEDLTSHCGDIVPAPGPRSAGRAETFHDTSVKAQSMLYLVDIQVNKSEVLDPEQWEALAQSESDYGMEARRNGKQLHIWRKAGAYAAVAVWDAEDHDELHELLSRLPLFHFLDITVSPLVEHPSTTRWAKIQAGEE